MARATQSAALEFVDSSPISGFLCLRLLLVGTDVQRGESLYFVPRRRRFLRAAIRALTRPAGGKAQAHAGVPFSSHPKAHRAGSISCRLLTISPSDGLPLILPADRVEAPFRRSGSLVPPAPTVPVVACGRLT